MRDLRARRAVGLAAHALGFVIATAGLVGVADRPAWADEGGVSFWLPGQFGSLIAIPGAPGWTMTGLYYHSSVDAGGNKTFPQGGEIRAGIDADIDIIGFGPGYNFDTTILGGQPSFSVLGLVGHVKASAEATLTGPNGNEISGEHTDTISGFGDLYPMATLKWNSGVNNYMVYVTGDIPVGDYDPKRLANLGIGHGAVDGGLGYTYFNPQTGHEFSIVGGLTYNFENPDTNYQNGIDSHIDWAASQFLSQQVHAGVAGYYYQQLTGDSGSGATLGDFESRVLGIGPQIGYFVPAGEMQAYVNVKGFYEFDAENRPEGWSAWLTIALTPKAGE